MSLPKVISNQPIHNINLPKLVLIDGYGYVFRAYHALARANMKRQDGTPVGAVYAFTNMLMKTIKDHEADYIAVVFDAGKKTFRNEIYDQYKANRPPAPDDLIPQFPLVREAAKALNIVTLEKEGYEADDLIATYAKIANESGYSVVIVSSDKDLMQLVSDGIEMYDPIKSKVITQQEVIEKFGVAPNRVLDVLSLMGDSSDNVPGVPGIGPKTAAELINRFGSLDEVLNNTDQITQSKRRQTLEDNVDQAILSRDLIKLCFDVPVDVKIEELVYKPKDKEVILSFLQEQGFISLIGKVLNSSNLAVKEIKTPEREKNNNKYQLINDINSLSQWIENQKEISIIAIYLLSDIKNKSDIAVALSVVGNSCYYPLKGKLEPVQSSLFAEEEMDMPGNFELVLKAIKSILEDRSINKIFYNAKPIIKLAKKSNIQITSFDDVMMMSYCLEAGMHKHDLESLLVRNDLLHMEEIIDNKTLCKSDSDQAENYLCNISSDLLLLYRKLRYRLFKENNTNLYLNIEKPLILALADMEIAGIKINISDLKSLSNIFASEIEKLEQQIYQLTGVIFNIGSPKQLGEVLFDKLGLKGGKKSKKTGAYSTDINVLQSLADEGNDIILKILQWRHISKIKTTYTDALPKQVASDGRIHSHFEMAVTNTGRLSSREPNLQNIPIRSEDGNKIRKAFIAERGFKLICADYSQIELRLLAHMADIPVLQDAFKRNMDIHAVTASEMFGMDVSEVTTEHRRRAKMINFGIIYGISAFGLAQRLGISRNEASEYIKQYFGQYPGIEAYMQKTIEFARENGFVQTIWGRKCYVNGINDRNAAIRQFSERASINAPLQGTAADIIKKALIILDTEIKKNGLNAKIILQVHDELLLEVKDDHVLQTEKLVKNVMENVISLSVPTSVDVVSGDNWQVVH